MVITWMTPHDLEAELRRAYPPHGLQLRPTLHARPDAEVVRRWVPIAPTTDDWLPGLGPLAAWGGFIGDTPFAILLKTAPWQGMGLQINVPLKLTVQGHLDLTLLPLLAELPSEVLRALVLIEPLPFKGAGHGVAPLEHPQEDWSFFRSPRAEDAMAIVDLLGSRCAPQRYCVVPVTGSRQLPWIVVGPPVGPFISCSFTAATQTEAEQVAEHYSLVRAAEFSVYDGPIAGDPAVTFVRGERASREETALASSPRR